jgi:hypothetical protein
MVMTRAMGMLCAALGIALAGCTMNFGHTRVDVAVKVDEMGVETTIDQAVAKLQTELQRRGIQTTVSPDGDAVRVQGTTKTGDKFTVVLSRGPAPATSQAGAGAEMTRVRVEWHKSPDSELWLGLVAALGAAAVAPAH